MFERLSFAANHLSEMHCERCLREYRFCRCPGRFQRMVKDFVKIMQGEI